MENASIIISEIINKFGIDILNNPNKFTLTFITLAPEMEKEEKILSFVLNQGIGKYFINCTEDNQKNSIASVKKILDGILAEDTINLVIDWFADALNWKLIDNNNGENIVRTFPIQHYFKEATNGDVLAQVHIGDCYYYGNEVKQDYAESVKWYKLSAEQGYFLAQHYLAYSYSTGKGIEKSDAEAMKWYEKAASQGYAKSQLNLGTLYYKQNNYQKAVELYEKASKQGNIKAQRCLGDCYYYGNGVEKNIKKAMELYLKPAEQGNELAQLQMGNCCCYGYGNLNDCLEWYKKSADQGNEEAKKKVNEILGKDIFPETKIKAEEKQQLVWKINFNSKNKPLSEVDKYLNPMPIDLYSVGMPKFKEKLPKAINAYAKNALNDRAFLLLDSTVLGSAKEGFILTNKHFFIKYIITESVEIDLRNISSLEIEETVLVVYYKTNNGVMHKYNVKYSSDIKVLTQYGNILCTLIEHLI